MTEQELTSMEKELKEHMSFALSVKANTGDLERQLEILRLAKLGLKLTAPFYK